MRKLYLCGGAAIALLTTPALGQGVGAQPLPPPMASRDGSYGAPRSLRSGPDDSTLQEEAQTEQLNAQGANGYYAPPQVLNGEAPGGLNAAQNDSSRTAEEYQRSQQQYQNSLEHYSEQRQDYRQAQARYREAMRRYDRAAWDFGDYPQQLDVSYGASSLASLTAAGPTGLIAGAPVQGPDGWEGRVIGWGNNEDGARAVEVALNHHFAVYVRPEHLEYDRRAGVLVTDLGKNALWDRPGLYLQAGYYARDEDGGDRGSED